MCDVKLKMTHQIALSFVRASRALEYGNITKCKPVPLRTAPWVLHDRGYNHSFRFGTTWPVAPRGIHY